MLLNCSAGEDSWESFGQQGDQTSQSTLNIHWKDWCWGWNSNTLATWYKLTHWKRPWRWERLKARGEGGDREWDGLMASLNQWHEFEQTPGDRASPGASVLENLPVNAGDIRNVGLILVSWRSPGGEHGNTLQYSCLDNPVDRGAWGLQSMGS